ncbi:MAG: hypothetical protein M1840_000912 [Geoglossum simile]|nr:MAG: hypothetical protein M1840_000912 [Geoglossum simile]
MSPNRNQKTSRDIVSEYDLRKVHIPYISEDGIGSASSPRLPQLPKTNRGRPALKPSSRPSTRTALQNPPSLKLKQVLKKRKGGVKKTIAPLPPESSDKLAENSQDEEEDPDMVAAQALLKAKDRFKKQRLRAYLQEKAKGVRAETPEDLTTSDVQQKLEDIIDDAQALADFPIEVNLRIYINKTIAKKKNLLNSSRDTLDLSIVEEALLEELETFIQGEVLNVHHTAIVQANTSRGTNKMHDLDDFSLGETERVLEMVNTRVRDGQTAAVSRPHQNCMVNTNLYANTKMPLLQIFDITYVTKFSFVNRHSELFIGSNF